MSKNKLTIIKNPRLYSNRNSIYKYDLGGAMDVASTAASQVAQVVGDITAVNDTAKKVKEDVKGQVTNPTAASSTEDLLSSWSAWNPTEHVTWKDLTKKGTGASYFADMLSMSAQGAAAGSSLSKTGAIASGAGGLVAGFIGNMGSKIKAKKKANELNKYIDAQNLSTQRAFENQALQLDHNLLNKELSDFIGWNSAAYGGQLFADGGQVGTLNTNGGDFSMPGNFISINEGGTHEENPNEGVPMGISQDGIPNLVEEGETIFNDYVFSKRLKVPKAIRDKYKVRGIKDISFADMSRKLAKESEERPNDPISKRGFENSMLELMIAQEQVRAKKQDKNKFAKGGSVRKYKDAGTLGFGPILEYDRDNPFNIDNDLLTNIKPNSYTEPIDISRPALEIIAERNTANAPIKFDSEGNPYKMDYSYYSSNPLSITPTKIDPTSENTTPKNEPNVENSKYGLKKNNKMDFLRYAPALSQGMQALTDALGLTNRPDFTLGKKIRAANNQIRDISTRAAGQKIGYKPIDQWAAINDFNAQMAAQRSALRNANNRVSSVGQLLASAYNQNKALGALYSGMEKENWDRYAKAVAHNTGIEQANRNAELQAAQYNATQSNLRANNLIKAAAADDNEETLYAQARATNRNNLFNTLGAIGKERIDRNMLKGLIDSGVFGTPNESMLKALALLGVNPETGTTKKGAYGGKINRKKKKGLTY